MKKLSLYAGACFLILWGINYYLIRDDQFSIPKLTKAKPVMKKNDLVKTDLPPVVEEAKPQSILDSGNVAALEKIGEVINENNVDIDQKTKDDIKKEKVKFDNLQNIKEKTAILEQSYMDKNSSMRDIKRLQGELQDLKIKAKMDINNTEKWDPMFVYYMMIQENYTYSEINQIKSLSENGISKDELNYINELIKEDGFKKQVMGYKNTGNVSRAVASFKKSKPKEQDEFVDGPSNEPAAEEKLIEMNYSQQQKEELATGHNL
jgi:hypothetical protein